MKTLVPVPSVGRVVLFNDGGVNRPAVVLGIDPDDLRTVELLVFRGAAFVRQGSVVSSFVCTASWGRGASQWHWPPRVDAMMEVEVEE